MVHPTPGSPFCRVPCRIPRLSQGPPPHPWPRSDRTQAQRRAFCISSPRIHLLSVSGSDPAHLRLITNLRLITTRRGDHRSLTDCLLRNALAISGARCVSRSRWYAVAVVEECPPLPVAATWPA